MGDISKCADPSWSAIIGHYFVPILIAVVLLGYMVFVYFDNRSVIDEESPR